MKIPHAPDRAGTAGFTLLEALVATALMGMILAAIGAITAQWLPGWDRGFVRVQRSELFSVALNRLAADLSASEYVTPNRESKLPIFEGSASSVTLVRTAVGPNTRPGLEVIRISESTDRQGVALVRTRAPFAPFGVGDVSAGQLKFSDPVVLLRAPYRVSFSYSGGDGTWSDVWQNANLLPSVVRFMVRDATTGRTLAISSAAIVHVELPAACVDPKAAADCGVQAAPGAEDPNKSIESGPATRGNASRGP
jgi:general secretion pathway protein J